MQIGVGVKCMYANFSERGVSFYKFMLLFPFVCDSFIYSPISLYCSDYSLLVIIHWLAHFGCYDCPLT